MIILGLNFGHDANISIIRDGKVLLCVERERLNHNKHTISLRAADIKKCLDDLNLQISDIDFVGVTNSQMLEYIFFDENLHFELKEITDHSYPCLFSQNSLLEAKNGLEEDLRFTKSNLLNSLCSKQSINPHIFLKWLSKEDAADYLKSPKFTPAIDNFLNHKTWKENNDLEKIKKTDYSFLIKDEALQSGFHHPCLLTLFNRQIPGYIISHHHCHAAYSFYGSAFEEAAICTADGGVDGFFLYAKENKIYSLTPNFLCIGTIYDYISYNLLNLDPGKMMGLASFGQADFYQNFKASLQGNSFPVSYFFVEDINMKWLQHCLRTAKNSGLDMKYLGDPQNILKEINVNLAASTQKLTEETLLDAVQTLHQLLKNSKIDSKNLCLSGGSFLNCPTNQKIIQKSSFQNIFIPPGISDSAIGLGAAWYLYYNIMDFKRNPQNNSPNLAYLGLTQSLSSNNIKAAIEKFLPQIAFEKIKNPALKAAEMLAQNKIIGWMVGQSENGPRALGHRSILANPLFKENQDRVNQIKKRENWRPLAPAILADEAHQYFEIDVIKDSFFMLINSKVKTDKLPAVTHIDGSARVQIVNSDCGSIYDLLKEFGQLSGVSCVLNTSFNGAKQPIIEEPSKAIQFLLESELDAVFLEDYLIQKI